MELNMSVLTNGSAGNAGNVGALLDFALRYLSRSWTFFPVKGKRPKLPWKSVQTTPPDDATLRRLFSKSDIDGIAVVLGSASDGRYCRDYDDRASYHRWAESHDQLASTLPTVETHRGRHL